MLDQDGMLYHNEPILTQGKIVGRITSGAYGHHLGGSVGLGYVETPDGMSAADCLARPYRIDIAGRLFEAEASLKPLYDPSGARMRM